MVRVRFVVKRQLARRSISSARTLKRPMLAPSGLQPVSPALQGRARSSFHYLAPTYLICYPHNPPLPEHAPTSISARDGKHMKSPLAYVFWHWPPPESEPGTYETSLIRFHQALAQRKPEGFHRSFVFRLRGAPWAETDGPLYEDWYLVEDFTALGLLNEGAVSGVSAPRRTNVVGGGPVRPLVFEAARGAVRRLLSQPLGIGRGSRRGAVAASDGARPRPGILPAHDGPDRSPRCAGSAGARRGKRLILDFGLLI